LPRLFDQAGYVVVGQFAGWLVVVHDKDPPSFTLFEKNSRPHRGEDKFAAALTEVDASTSHQSQPLPQGLRHDDSARAVNCRSHAIRIPA